MKRFFKLRKLFVLAAIGTLSLLSQCAEAKVALPPGGQGYISSYGGLIGVAIPQGGGTALLVDDMTQQTALVQPDADGHVKGVDGKSGRFLPSGDVQWPTTVWLGPNSDSYSYWYNRGNERCTIQSVEGGLQFIDEHGRSAKGTISWLSGRGIVVRIDAWNLYAIITPGRVNWYGAPNGLDGPITGWWQRSQSGNSGSNFFETLVRVVKDVVKVAKETGAL